MSREIIKLSLREEAMPQIKDEWFDAYLEGNMRVPQTVFGIELFILDAVLKEAEPSIEKLIDTQLTQEQLTKMRNAMNAAHTVRHIPNRSTDKINEAVTQIEKETKKVYPPNPFEVQDSRLERLWRDFTKRIPKLIEKFMERAGIDVPKESIREIAIAVEGRPDLLDKLKRLASAGVEALRSDEGKKLANDYRDILNLKKHGQPEIPIKNSEELFYHLREKSLDAQEALAEYIVKFIVEKYPDLDNYISPEILIGER